MNYLIIYAAVIGFIVFVREFGQRTTMERFAVADRDVRGVVGAMSIAASWIWAPAIFISTQVGYEWGYSGLVWFCLPNMLALLLFAPLAARVRRRLPEGYSYIQSLKDGDRGFFQVQLVLQLAMQIVIFAIQLLAGAEMLARLTGTEFHFLVIGMALTPLAYTVFSGLRTSIFTDALQYFVIALAAIAILLVFPSASQSFSFDSRPFEPLQLDLLTRFGVSSALGLIVAIFADHQQWQRIFAIRHGQIVRTFSLAAWMHGFVTLALGTFGCMIAASGFRPDGIDMVGFEYIQKHYALLFIPVFVVMAMCALISTLDSALCAFSSLAMRELGRGPVTLRNGRRWMLVLTLGGIGIALLRPALLTLWFIACTIRLSSFAPTVLSIVSPEKPTKAYTMAILLALLIGGTLFGCGTVSGNMPLRTFGMISTLLISGSVLAIAKLLRNRVRFEAHTASSPI